MSSPYHVGQPPHRRHPVRIALLTVGLIIILSLSIYAYKAMQPETTITQSTSRTSPVDIGIPPVKQIVEPTFEMKIPSSWVQARDAPIAAKSWHGSGQADGARRIDVYIDTIPSAMAVNRLMPVLAEGNRLRAVNDVSDNCVNFTDQGTANPMGVAPSKWSGFNFLCDMANTLRNVVGTGSSDPRVNTTTMKSEAGVTRTVFLVYTDHSGQADFEIFKDIIDSFVVR